MPYSNSWLPVLASELSGSLAACDRSPHFMKLSKGLVRPSLFVCSALGRNDRQRLHTDRQNPVPCRCPAPAYLLSLYFCIVSRAVPMPAHTLYRSSCRLFLRLVLSVFQILIPCGYRPEKIVWSLSATLSLSSPSAIFQSVPSVPSPSVRKPSDMPSAFFSLPAPSDCQLSFLI